MSSDPQTWTFPPPGDASPAATAITADFGPVHYQDSIILNWSPATAPNIVWSCFSANHNETGYYAIQGASPPATYRFSQQAKQQNSTDRIYCKFYFTSTTNGNTVQFEYSNTPQAKAVTWQAGGASTASSAATTSAPSSSATTFVSTSSVSSSRSTSMTASSTSASSSATAASSSGGGLSAGAGAGIGVGVGLGVIGILALIAFLFMRRRKRARGRVEGTHVAEMDGTPGQHNSYVGDATGQTYHEKHSNNPSEMAHTPVTAELP